MDTTCVFSACRSQKASNSMEMELWIAVNHYVRLGNQTGSFVRAASTLNCWVISPVSLHVFWNKTKLIWNSDLPASVSPVMKLRVCDTIPGDLCVCNEKWRTRFSPQNHLHFLHISHFAWRWFHHRSGIDKSFSCGVMSLALYQSQCWRHFQIWNAKPTCVQNKNHI